MKKEEQAPGTERVTIAVTLDFAGFGAGTCTVGITSIQDESLSEDAKRLQVSMMAAIGEAMDKLFGGLGKAKATAKKED